MPREKIVAGKTYRTNSITITPSDPLIDRIDETVDSKTIKTRASAVETALWKYFDLLDQIKQKELQVVQV